MVNAEVDDGLNVDGHVNLNDSRQGQGPGRPQPAMRLRQARTSLFDTLEPGRCSSRETLAIAAPARGLREIALGQCRGPAQNCS
jgi:hypothetical protein